MRVWGCLVSLLLIVYLVLTLISLNFNHNNKYIDVVRTIRFVWILDDNNGFVLNIRTVAKVVI